MARQHATPILIPSGGPELALVPLADAGERVSEAEIQRLVHDHPSILPIAEIEPTFVGAVSLCRELDTPAGPIDNFLVTPSGLPVVVECKLWRNPEARREVVGQIIDYAKELARMTFSDLEQRVGRARGAPGASLAEVVRAAGAVVDEVDFHDNLSRNLREGRFLLLLVGDGIRERVEAIAEFVQDHVGLRFSLGMVELAFFRMPDGGRLVAPRVLAKTHVITRSVIILPDGVALQSEVEAETEREVDPDTVALGDARQAFWTEFLQKLKLDDPEQVVPRAPRMGYVTFTLAASGTSWITVYRNMKTNEVGLNLSSHRDTPGEYARKVVGEAWAEIQPLLGGTATMTFKNGLPLIGDRLQAGPLEDDAVRARAFDWLAERTNTFINVLRPRVRSAVADYQQGAHT